MSKFLILTDDVKKHEVAFADSDKYTVSDTLTDVSCDVICVSRGTKVQADDISMVANLLETRSVVIGCKMKKSLLKSLIYKFFGVGHGENNTGITGIPSEHIESLTPSPKTRVVRLIKAAEENKIPVCEIPLPHTESKRGPLGFIGDLISLFFVSQPLKFIFSSGMAFIIDYLLLILLNAQLSSVSVGSMEISALIAWCVSSLTNFFLNRYFVFRSNSPFWPSFAEYYGLAGAVFVLKTYVLLEILTRVLHINLPIAKLICEVVFFISNYFIQKKLIFRRKNTEGEKAPE